MTGVCVCVCFTSSGVSPSPAGLMVGAVWGVGEGVQREVGVSTRLRLTTIVNGVTRRGPFLANNLAVLGSTCIHCNSLHMTVL